MGIISWKYDLQPTLSRSLPSWFKSFPWWTDSFLVAAEDDEDTSWKFPLLRYHHPVIHRHHTTFSFICPVSVMAPALALCLWNFPQDLKILVFCSIFQSRRFRVPSRVRLQHLWEITQLPFLFSCWGLPRSNYLCFHRRFARFGLGAMCQSQPPEFTRQHRKGLIHVNVDGRTEGTRTTASHQNEGCDLLEWHVTEFMRTWLSFPR